MDLCIMANSVYVQKPVTKVTRRRDVEKCAWCNEYIGQQYIKRYVDGMAFHVTCMSERARRELQTGVRHNSREEFEEHTVCERGID